MAVVSETRPISAADFPEIRWHGHWIWVPEEPNRAARLPSALVSTRKRLRPTACFAKPSSSNACPTACPPDHRRLALRAVRQWPGGLPRPHSQPAASAATTTCSTSRPSSSPGENVSAVYVKYYGTPKPYWMPGGAQSDTRQERASWSSRPISAPPAGWSATRTWQARKADAWFDDWRADDLAARSAAACRRAFDARRFPARLDATRRSTIALGRSASRACRCTSAASPAPNRPPTPTARSTPARSPSWAARPAACHRARRDVCGNGRHATAQPGQTRRAPRSASRPRSPVRPTLRSRLRVELIDMGRIVSGFVQFE